MMVSPYNALESLSAKATEIAPLPDLKAPQLQTEQAAKQALVLPFITALGYDIFDHTEVVPEFVADFGNQQGWKADYAIVRDDKPIIIFECKRANDPLDRDRASQLGRYFPNTEARVGVLTGGLRYKFYSDLVQPNTMDREPFLEFDIRTLDSNLITELERFSKGQFNIEAIKESATRMRHVAGIRAYLEGMYNQPDEALVRQIATYCGYPGPGTNLTQERLERFTNLVKETIQGFIPARIAARQQIADYSPPDDDTNRVEGDIITAYEMVQAILGSVVGPERVNIHNTRSYCAVVLDGNPSQTICRFRFGPRVKRLCFGPATGEEQHSLESLANISDHAEQLQETARRYLQG